MNQLVSFNPLSTKFTKWSNTLKQFVGFCRRIVWVCLTILWDWHLRVNYYSEDDKNNLDTNFQNYQTTFSEVIIPLSHCVTLHRTGFIHIYERNPERKLFFLHSVSNSYSQSTYNIYIYMPTENTKAEMLKKGGEFWILY